MIKLPLNLFKTPFLVHQTKICLNKLSQKCNPEDEVSFANSFERFLKLNVERSQVLSEDQKSFLIDSGISSLIDEIRLKFSKLKDKFNYLTERIQSLEKSSQKDEDRIILLDIIKRNLEKRT